MRTNLQAVDDTSSQLRSKISALEDELRNALDLVDSNRASLTALLLRHDPEFRVNVRDDQEENAEHGDDDFTSTCTYTLEAEIDRVRGLYFGEGCEWTQRYDSEGRLEGCFPNGGSPEIPTNFKESAKRLEGPPRTVHCVKTIHTLKQRCLASLTVNSKFITAHVL